MIKFRGLSFDVSASSTGWSFLSNKSNKFEFGTIKTKPKFSTAERLDTFRKEFIKLVKKYKPTVIVLEDTFVGLNPKVNKLLSKFGGVAEQVVFELTRKPPIIVSNKTVKAFFGTKKKEALFIVVSDLLEWDTEEFTYKKYNDVADASAQLIYACDKLLKVKVIREELDYGYRFNLKIGANKN